MSTIRYLSRSYIEQKHKKQRRQHLSYRGQRAEMGEAKLMCYAHQQIRRWEMHFELVLHINTIAWNSKLMVMSLKQDLLSRKRAISQWQSLALCV